MEVEDDRKGEELIFGNDRGVRSFPLQKEHVNDKVTKCQFTVTRNHKQLMTAHP